MAPSKKTWGWLHRRTESFKAQSQSLISTSRPVSYLHPVQEEQRQENGQGSSNGSGSPVQQSHEQDGRGSTVPTNSSSHPHANMSSVPQPKEKDNLPPPVVQTGPRDSSDAENGTYSPKMNNLKELLMREIDGSRASAPLTAYCFMTGFIDAVCFSAIFVWCAFQTGNSVQLALALARLFNGAHDYSFHIADRQALCSVLSFIFGAFIGRLGNKIGSKTRLWMTLGTFIQALFTMAAAIAIWKSGQPSVSDSRDDPAWGNVASFVCVGFMSASMGLQGIMGKRLNTQFTTTVVLTTTWCELMTEPQLFHFRRLVRSRDHKVMAILFLFIGGFTGRAILDKIGSAGTLGVGAGVRFLITLSWLFVPVKKTSKN
ncbi:hypothetical protein EDD16DRAFT_1604822 [Pisolithus croceorrhizus]|nr:hypothetical protein EDD16DRAFT_1604822 [Pisolithus croceorrhizus]KAI6118612.1 hypothetical protein EV401DRAFT_1546253 [Pisolithus croceorrhizus]KAI6138356.1 hypothetical protein EDD17DRAFT_1674306 [Pisolithus thermaeus]